MCASRARAARFPTWARRPPEPRQSSEAGSSCRTTKTRLYMEPPLSPGPSPVGSALLHLLESRHRHQALFTSPLTECLEFRLVAWANPGNQQHHWPPLPPAGTWPTPTTLQTPSYCSKLWRAMQLFPTSLRRQSFCTLWELSKGRSPGPKTLRPTGPSMPKVKRFSELGLYQAPAGRYCFEHTGKANHRKRTN